VRIIVLAAITAAAFAGCQQSAPSPGVPAASTSAAPPQTPQLPPTPITSEDDLRLSEEVTRFLDVWMVKRDPAGAVKGQVSEAFALQRFLAADGLSAQERGRLATASENELNLPVAPLTFERALARELATTLEPPATGLVAADGLAQLLVPFSRAAARENEPDLWTQWLEKQSPRDIDVAGVSGLAYQVRGWNDVAWAVTWDLDDDDLAERIRAGTINVQAVITRLRVRGDRPQPLIVTMWSDEGRPGGEWRLLTVLAPPVN
jgi:hypothetical protein